MLSSELLWLPMMTSGLYTNPTPLSLLCLHPPIQHLLFSPVHGPGIVVVDSPLMLKWSWSRAGESCAIVLFHRMFLYSRSCFAIIGKKFFRFWFSPTPVHTPHASRNCPHRWQPEQNGSPSEKQQPPAPIHGLLSTATLCVYFASLRSCKPIIIQYFNRSAGEPFFTCAKVIDIFNFNFYLL